jgi:hypothetical protein
MNQTQVDWLKIVALLIVGAGAYALILRGFESLGATLLGGILGYVFGNAHGLFYALRAKEGGD